MFAIRLTKLDKSHLRKFLVNMQSTTAKHYCDNQLFIKPTAGEYYLIETDRASKMFVGDAAWFSSSEYRSTARCAGYSRNG
jgi:hypothetical protein